MKQFHIRVHCILPLRNMERRIHINTFLILKHDCSWKRSEPRGHGTTNKQSWKILLSHIKSARTVLWREKKNTGRHKILSLSYLVVTLQAQEHSLRCDKQKSISITYLMRYSLSQMPDRWCLRESNTCSFAASIVKFSYLWGFARNWTIFLLLRN